MTVQYLGFCIGQGKIWAVPDKVATLRDVPLPTLKKKKSAIPRPG